MGAGERFSIDNLDFRRGRDCDEVACSLNIIIC